MRETLIEMFDDEKERENVFEFLKSPEFVTLLMNEQKPLENYKPTSAGANNLNSKVTSEANGVTETRTPPKV